MNQFFRLNIWLGFRQSLRLGSTAVLATSAIFIALFVQAQESVKIVKKEVPEAVLSAFSKAYPNASVKTYLREMRDGKTCYELETKDGSTARDIIYTANGEVMEIEEALKPNALPPVVLATIARTHPKAKITAAERLKRGDVIQFEAMLNSNGKKINLVFSESGDLVTPKLK